MTESTDFPISVTYSQIGVFNHSLDRPFNEWTDRHVTQGFSWRSGTVAFATIEEDGNHPVSVEVSDDSKDPDPRVTRVIDVPFEVSPSGEIEIGSISSSVKLALSPGTYQLRFECGMGEGDPRKVAFRFFRSEQPHFGIVRADSEIETSKDLLLTALPA